MPTLTINIANSGTQLSSGGTSSVGHMYYVITNGSGETKSYGFAPDEAHHGQSGVFERIPGQVYRDDASEEK